MNYSRIRFTTIYVLLLALLTTLAVVVEAAPRTLSIALTNKGIVTAPRTMRGGEYTVIVKNFTSVPRGIEMTGKDRGGTPYARYSKVLGTGQRQSFRWFFPRGQRVIIRDILRYEMGPNNTPSATFGNMRAVLRPR